LTRKLSVSLCVFSCAAHIRQHFTPEQVEIRVDANGVSDLNEALDKITQLSEFKLHSIEQPIQKNNTDRMADLCKTTFTHCSWRGVDWGV
jgi:L-alanine-DL-glutamate epimerase-like enolase superfamily enzyme